MKVQPVPLPLPVAVHPVRPLDNTMAPVPPCARTLASTKGHPLRTWGGPVKDPTWTDFAESRRAIVTHTLSRRTLASAGKTHVTSS